MAAEITESITITLPEEVPTSAREITIVDPAAVAAPEPTPAAPEKVVEPPAADSPQDALNALKKQLADRETELNAVRELANRETTARQGFERMARDNAGRAEQFRTQASDASYDSVVNALTSAQTHQDHLEKQISEAYEKADFPLAAKLQAEMARVGAKVVNLEDSKARIEADRAAAPTQVQQPTQPVQEPPGQFFNRAWNQPEFDSYIATRTPATASWLRANARFASEPGFRQKVAAAHNYITTVRGVVVDSPDYFRGIEDATGVTQAAPEAVRADPVSVAATPVATAPARTPAPAAPPSRNTPSSGRNGSPTQITLSPEQRAIARQILAHVTKDGKDPEVVYAQQLAASAAEGKIGTAH